ncbi:MAG TPA: FAD-dependent oxidoreductase [Pirellulaceae bacterium]|jgi:hypothetical protein|nr:FAD-dependent oxidoreductase [Pirellulaceae bacterium]
MFSSCLQPASLLRPACFAAVFAIFGAGPALARAEEDFDVVVFGGTPAGVTAAVGAAREGASVALLEPQEIVGGMMSGGLSFSDSNQTDRRTLRGLFEEIHLRIEADYRERGVALPYRVAVKDQAKWTYEPHVAEKVFHDLLKEAGVRVYPGERLEGVEKEDGRIVSLTTQNRTVRGKVFVDATYEGDLLPAAGVSFRLGREGRAEFGESLAGKQFPKKPVLGVDVRDANGSLLPLMTAEDAGDEAAGDDGVMVYSYRLCLTKDPANRVPLEAPANYDPARYELVRRFVTAHPPQRLLFDLYELPGGKSDGNNSIGGQISIGLVGASAAWCDASYDKREQIRQEHREYTQGLLWFMATDPAMPAKLREEMQSWGYARDEFAKWNHFPPVLYVREGRRLQGEYVLTQRDVLEATTKEDSIAVSSFPIDSHDVHRVPTPDGTGFVNEGTIFPNRLKSGFGQPHQIPYRAIVPQRDECTNLLVPVGVSSTHVAMSSIRVEPTWMTVGHSAGVAAALAAKSDLAVQDLPYAELRGRLLAQGQALDLLPIPEVASAASGIDPATLPGIVIDDAAARKDGAWQASTNFRPYIGAGYVHDGESEKGTLKLTFVANVPQAGKYDLRLAYSPHETRASAVPVTVRSGDRETALFVDQRLPLDANDRFRTIATLDLSAGETSVVIENRGTDGFVVVDAVQLLLK